MAQIINGPGKWDFVLALFDRALDRTNRVWFDVLPDVNNPSLLNEAFPLRGKTYIDIWEIGCVSQQGQDITFRGIVTYPTHDTGPRVRGGYNFQTRIGWIVIDEDKAP
jgi:hypothetical protein